MAPEKSKERTKARKISTPASSRKTNHDQKMRQEDESSDSEKKGDSKRVMPKQLETSNQSQDSKSGTESENESNADRQNQKKSPPNQTGHTRREAGKANGEVAAGTPQPSAVPKISTPRRAEKRKRESNSPADTEDDVPVKEVLMFHSPGRGNTYKLDRETLRLVKQLVTNTAKMDCLEEDDVAHQGLKLEKVAQDKVLQHSVMYGAMEADSQDIFNNFRDEEENHAMGKELLQDTVSELEKGDTKPDKSTISWIRRAAGIHRSKHALDGALGRRLDTGKSKYTRKAARENKHDAFNFIVDAIKEMEADPSTCLFKSPKASGNGQPPPRKKAKSAPSLREKSPPKQQKLESSRSQSKSDKQTKKATAGQNENVGLGIGVESISSREDPKEAAERSEREWYAQRILKDALQGMSIEDSYVWEREFEPLNPRERGDVVTPLDYKDRFRRFEEVANMVGGSVRLPEWEAVKSHSSGGLSDPEIRQPLSTCAGSTHKLSSYLSSGGRSFAMHEFCYSDIDCDWYAQDVFSCAAAKLGVPRGARLTKSEWRLVRKKMLARPRLFSKRFISRQLNDRNSYRSRVRRIQHSQGEPQVSNFSYKVVAPVPIGATVTVLDRKHATLKTGTVLSFDRASFRYLVQFEGAQLRHELVPDTDICVQGGPRYIHDRASTTLQDGFSNITRGLSHNAISPDHIRKGGATTDCNDILSELLLKDKNRHQKSKVDLIDKVVERECLLAVVQLYEQSLHRKRLVLSCLERLENREYTEPTRADLTWLKSCLGQTNIVIEKTRSLARFLYLDGWLSFKVNAKAPTEKDHIITLLKALEGDETSRDLSLRKEWMFYVARTAFDLAERMIDCESDDASSENSITSKRLQALVSGLLVSEYCLAIESTSALGMSSIKNLLDIVFSDLFSLSFPSPPSGSIYENALIERSDAIAGLKMSLSRLKAELSLSTIRDELRKADDH